MTHKPIRYSDHAAEQLRARRISRADVRWLIAVAPREKARTLHSSEQRWRVEGRVSKRNIYAVFIERSHEIEVVTVAEVY